MWTFSSGLLDFSVFELFLYTLVCTHLLIVSVTLYLHRYMAHRSFELSPFASHPMRFIIWLFSGMITRQWVAIHRKHHAKCESSDDPHSPVYHGIWNILFLGVFAYTKEAKNPSTILRYARIKGLDYPDDFIENKLYTPHNWLGIVLSGLTHLILFGLLGLLVTLVTSWWIPFWAAGVINGLGHFAKQWKIPLFYQNWKDGDPIPATLCRSDEKGNKIPEKIFNAFASSNIVPWGLWIGGEELHNNHHAFPTSPRFSRKWYEIDLGWVYLKILCWSKLAKLKPGFR
jgi:stearoyl-CoA desaturase (Delta-9 desaturase)